MYLVNVLGTCMYICMLLHHAYNYGSPLQQLTVNIATFTPTPECNMKPN